MKKKNKFKSLNTTCEKRLTTFALRLQLILVFKSILCTASLFPLPTGPLLLTIMPDFEEFTECKIRASF